MPQSSDQSSPQPAGQNVVTLQRAGVTSLKWHFFLWSASAVLLAVAFPRPGWWWAAHLALVPMTLLALRGTRAWRLVWTGYLVFLVWWLVMLRWMYPVTIGGTVGLCIFYAVYVPVTMWLVRWIDRRFRVPMVFALPMVWVSVEYLRGLGPSGGFGWFAIAHTQAPWLDTHGASRLIQIADVLGEWGVGLLVAMTNGAIVDVLNRPVVMRLKSAAATSAGGTVVARGLRSFHHAMANISAGWAAACWVLCILIALLYGQYRLNETNTAVRPGPRIAVVQTNVPQDNRIRATEEEREQNWQTLLSLTRDAAKSREGVARPDIIVWPETITPSGLNPQAVEHFRTTRYRGWRGDEKYHNLLLGLAEELDMHLFVGAPAYFDWQTITVQMDDGREGSFQTPGRRFNSAYLYRPDGTQADQRYDKVHRVPFGEYIPWVDAWPWLKQQFITLFSPYEVDYTLQAGKVLHVFEVQPPLQEPDEQTGAQETNDTTQGRENTTELSSKWSRVAEQPVGVVTPICFEDTVGRVVRRMIYGAGGGKRADVIVNLTNDGWFIRTDQPLQHLQIAVFRSVENRVPTARSVNTGTSGFIDSAGRVGPIVRQGDDVQDIAGTAAHSVDLDSRTTVFGRIGSWPMFIIAALTGGLVLLGFIPQRSIKPQAANQAS